MKKYIYIEKAKQTNKKRQQQKITIKKKQTKKKKKKQISSNLSPTSWGFQSSYGWLELFAIISNLFLNTQPPDLEIKTLAMLCFLLLSVTFKVYLSLGIRFCKFTTSSLAHLPT